MLLLSHPRIWLWKFRFIFFFLIWKCSRTISQIFPIPLSQITIALEVRACYHVCRLWFDVNTAAPPVEQLICLVMTALCVCVCVCLHSRTGFLTSEDPLPFMLHLCGVWDSWRHVHALHAVTDYLDSPLTLTVMEETLRWWQTIQSFYGSFYVWEAAMWHKPETKLPSPTTNECQRHGTTFCPSFEIKEMLIRALSLQYWLSCAFAIVHSPLARWAIFFPLTEHWAYRQTEHSLISVLIVHVHLSNWQRGEWGGLQASAAWHSSITA